MDIWSGVIGLVAGLLGGLFAYRSQLRAMGPELRALWKARGIRHRYHIGRAVRRGEKLEDPGDAALAASLARYQKAVLQSPWSMLSIATLPVLLGILGIAAAIADDPIWLALTAGALLLLGTLVLFRRRTLSRITRTERANHVSPT